MEVNGRTQADEGSEEEKLVKLIIRIEIEDFYELFAPNSFPFHVEDE